MKTRHARLFALAAVVLVAGALLAGCTQSTRIPGERELGAAFVKRSCTETTPRSTALDGPAPGLVPEVDPPSGLAALAFQANAAPEIVVGTLLPTEDMRRAAELAAEQVNAGREGTQGALLRIRLVHGDDPGEDAGGAREATQTLVGQGTEVLLVGATGAAAVGAVLDRAVPSRVLVLATASGAPSLTLDRNNQGYFFRMPASTALEGRVLADLVWDDGCRRVAILAADDDGGSGLGRVFREAFQQKGGTVSEFVRFSATSTSFSGEVQAAARGDPDAVVVIGGADAGADIVKEAFRQNKMKKTVWFFSSGMRTDAFVQDVGRARNTETNRDEYIVAGLRGSGPAVPRVDDSFRLAWMQRYGGEPGRGAAETYDAVMLTALAGARAMNQGQELRGEFIKDGIRPVANRSPGDTPVTGATIQQGLLLASTGAPVDYQGAAGDHDLDARGEPDSGVYSWWKVNEDGSVQTTRENVRPGEPQN